MSNLRLQVWDFGILCYCLHRQLITQKLNHVVTLLVHQSPFYMGKRNHIKRGFLYLIVTSITSDCYPVDGREAMSILPGTYIFQLPMCSYRLVVSFVVVDIQLRTSFHCITLRGDCTIQQFLILPHISVKCYFLKIRFVTFIEWLVNNEY